MESRMNTYKRDLGFRWIKAETGNTYLCPASSLSGDDNLSEQQLRALCVDESQDPQNS